MLTAQDASAIGVPPAYLSAVGAFAASPYVCGSAPVTALAFTSFQPADQLNRGATLAGTLEVGKVLIAGFASVQSRFVTNATPLTAALTPGGTQVPGTPLHRAGLVATAKLGRSVDVLANANYTGANNPSRLPAYTVFNAGFAAPLREGSLALVATNLGNAHAGPFLTGADVFALPRAGAVPLALAATPLAPRAVALTYTVRVGRLGAAGSGAATTEAVGQGDDSHGGVELRIRATRMREGAHPDALQIDPDNDACTPAAAKIAQPVMDAMGRLSAAAERAKLSGRYPASIPGGTATVSGVALRFVAYDGGARYAIAATAPDLRAGAAFLNCARLSVAQPDERETYHFYLPAEQERGTFFIGYTPLLGVYFAPPAQAGHGAVLVRAGTDPEPAAAPADPFALRPAPACAAGSKPVAVAIVEAVRAARTAQRAQAAIPAAELAEIVARGPAATGWLEIKPADPIAQSAIVQCLHVAAVAVEHLRAAGIEDARRPGALGFTDRFGFYIITRPDEEGAPARP